MTCHAREFILPGMKVPGHPGIICRHPAGGAVESGMSSARSRRSGNGGGPHLDDSLLADSFPGIIYRYSSSGQTPLVFAGNIEGMTGYPPGDFTEGRREWIDIVHPDDLHSAMSCRGVLQDEQPATSEKSYRIVRSDGSVAWVRDYCARIVTGEDHDDPVCQGTIFDVTEARLAEDALRARQEELDGILRSVPAGVAVVRNGLFLEVNERFCAMVGLRREDLAGSPTAVVFESQGEHDRVMAALEGMLAGGRTGSAETVLRGGDGGTVEVILNSALLNPASPEQGRTFIALDNSERIRADRRIRENERLLENLFSSVQDGISVLDRDLRIIRVNTAMERWYTHAMPLEAKKCYEAYHLRSEPCVVCPSRRALDTRTAQSDIVPLTGEGGSVTGWLELFAFPLIDETSGEVTGVIEYVRDISSRVSAENALKRERDLLRSIYRASPAGILLYGTDGMLRYCNRRTSEILGVPMDHLVGRSHDDPVFDPRYPDDRPVPAEELPLSRVVASRSPVIGTRFSVATPSGRRVVSINASPLDDDSGGLAGVVATLEDVTEQLAAEDALRRSEEFDRTLIVESPIGISVRTSRGRLLSHNKAWQRIWAMSNEDVLEDMNRERDRLCLDDRDGYLADWTGRVREVYEKGGTLNIPEMRTSGRRPGSATWVSQHFYAIPGPDGEVERVVILTEDISTRKAAEEALKESEERYRILAEAARDMIFVIDREDRITYVNTTASRALGVDPPDAVGRPRSDFFPMGIAERQGRSLAGLFESGEPVYIENDAEFHGAPCWLGTWLVPLKSTDGTITGILGVARDITARIRSEELERSLREQLNLAQKMESVGRLAGGVAHDFNNLLTVILGHVELVLEDLPKLDTPLRNSIQEVKKAGERARDLTHQLLAFGRKQLLVMRNVNLNELIDDFASILERLIGEDVHITTSLEPGLGLIQADVTQIEQVLMNLAVNARDAMPSGGRLVITTSNCILDYEYASTHPEVSPGLHVLLSVSDTGAGMDDEVLKHIFEPFYTTKDVGRGTGLGLSTVYGIVKQHGGHIAVYSEPGRGTTFRIYLPVSGQDAASPAQALPEPGPPGGGATVMVVEDDEPVRLLMCRILRQSGFEVVEAPDAVSAGGLAAERGCIDLLLTDVVMPVMSGGQVYEAVKSVCPEVRVLYVSGYTDDIVAHHGLLDDGVSFLQKPFTIDGLLRKVRLALEG